MKKFLIFLIVFCSAFFISNKVSAEEIINDEKFVLPFTNHEKLQNRIEDVFDYVYQNTINYNPYDRNYYDSYFCYQTYYPQLSNDFLYEPSNIDNYNSIRCNFFNKEDENSNFYIGNIIYGGGLGYDINFNKSVEFYINHITGENPVGTYHNSSGWSGSTYENVFSNGYKIFYFSNTDIYVEYYDEYVPSNEIDNEFTINFHLNGGKVTVNDEVYYDDYSIEISSDKFEDYILSQTVENETMHFQGWYYDEKFLNRVNLDDILNKDIDLYAKWTYKNVEDFLNNTNFKKYTFDSNYEYAMISQGNNNGDIYIGLQKRLYNLEIYEYNEQSNEYIKGSTINLVPIYSKNGIYYYKLDSTKTENLDIIAIPRSKLEDTISGEVKTYYEFYLTENTELTYTNDLAKVIIYDSEGNQIETNLQDSYDYSQDALINNENDLLEIFKDLAKNKDNNVFSYINQIWNYLKRSKLYIYFLVLIVGGMIIMIIKSANRK